MTASDTRRVESRGGGHWYRLDGEKVDGVTTVLSNGLPKPALVPWAAREVATFAVDNLETIANLKHDEAIDLLKGAHYRERDRGARRGTEVHRYAEHMINGEEVDVPEELVAHVDSYIKFLGDFDVQPVLVEPVVGNRTHRWMGTADLVADLNDGLRRLVDVKTNRSGVFPDNVLQLAAYRNAEFYLDAYGREHSMIPVDACAIIWVRADGYDLVPVDAGPAAYRIFRHCQQIAHWQTVTSKEAIGDVIQPIREPGDA